MPQNNNYIQRKRNLLRIYFYGAISVPKLRDYNLFFKCLFLQARKSSEVSELLVAFFELQKIVVFQKRISASPDFSGRLKLCECHRNHAQFHIRNFLKFFRTSFNCSTSGNHIVHQQKMFSRKIFKFIHPK